MADRLNRYLNETAFGRPDSDSFGSAPRHLNYRGPRLNTMDAALLKGWETKENQRLEFRVEAFISCPVDHTHATRTDLFNDPVVPQRAADQNGVLLVVSSR